MEETKKKVEKLCELKEKMICELECACSKSEWSPMVCGEVVDMIKDLAEAEEKCWKSCYYKTIIHEMKERENEPRYGEPSGYDNRRYASGRFAPKGKGHYSPMGYDDDGFMMETDEFKERVYGYSENPKRSMHSGKSNRWGKAYEQYENAKRHYTESGSSKDRKEMDTHAMEHLDDVVDTTKEIMKHADPSLLKQMKSEFTALINSIPG